MGDSDLENVDHSDALLVVAEEVGNESAEDFFRRSETPVNDTARQGCDAGIPGNIERAPDARFSAANLHPPRIAAGGFLGNDSEIIFLKLAVVVCHSRAKAFALLASYLDGGLHGVLWGPFSEATVFDNKTSL